MHRDTTWKCHRCDLMFEKEYMALAHNSIFKHEIKKTSIVN